MIAIIAIVRMTIPRLPRVWRVDSEMPLRAATEVRSSVHIAHDLTIAQDDETFRKTLIIGIVRNEKYRHAQFVVHSRECRHHPFARFRIEVARRLISEEHRWSIDQRAGNRNTLLLSAREFRRSTAGAILEIKHREQFPGLQPSLSQGSADMSEAGRRSLRP